MALRRKWYSRIIVPSCGLKDAAQYPLLTRANITKYLRGLVPDQELDAWDCKYSVAALTSPRR